MYSVTEQLVNANKVRVETLATIADAAFSGTERLAALNVGAAKGQSAFVATAGGTTAGWVYDATAGTIIANTTAAELDSAGNKYSTY